MKMSHFAITNNARASPAVGDAHRPRLNDVRSMLGLPTQGRGGLKKLAACEIRLATINVGTMTGRSRELADTLKNRRIDIACVQETRWKGSKAKLIGDGYKLIYHGTTNGRNGVAVAVSQRMQDGVTEVSRVTDRLMSIKLQTGKTTFRIVSCYAPQTGCTDEEKDEFWETLDTHLRNVSPDELLVIGGDLNGHVGQDNDGFGQAHGGHGYGTRNDDGTRILECAEANDLVVANTFFPKRPSHLITYSSSIRNTQIDYFLLRRRNLTQVIDAKVIPSDQVSAQHKPLVLTLRLRDPVKQKLPQTKTERIKWWKLKEHKPQLQASLATLDVDFDQPTTEIWNDITKQITTIASTILGKTKPGRRFIDKQTWWWNEEVQQAIKEKKAAFKVWRQTNDADDLQRYRTLKSAAKREVAKAKANHYNDLYDQLGSRDGERMIYRLCQTRDRATKELGHVMQIKDTQGTLLQDPTAVLSRWKEHYARTCNEENPHPPIPISATVPGPVPRITAHEVMKAIRKMKNEKATGPDDIPVDVWKLLGQRGAEILSALFNKIADDHDIPASWQSSVTVPIYKGKGDISDCSNYRPIRLLCHGMKIFERVIDARLRSMVEITPNQCGFVKGKSTTDAIHAARLVMERHHEKRKTVHLAFLDLEKAFDRVPHSLIWHALRSHGVPETYIKWVQLLYTNTTSTVRCAAGLSKPFGITVGVHQGSALSPLLFNICMDTVTADIQTAHPWTLLFADDVMLAHRTRRGLERLVQTWKDRLEEYGMKLNISKTEYLQCGPQTDGSIKVGDQDLKKVEQFKYLGSYVSADTDSLHDARMKTNAAWQKWRQVTGVLCDRRMPSRLKSKVYKTVVRPVALYGTECWATTRKHERTLHTMEMRMLRWMLGLTRMDHVMNTDVRKVLGIAPINEKMQEYRLRWYGHTLRREPESIARTALDLTVPGKRPLGRPKKRYMDTIREDMRSADVTNADAADRANWRSKCKRPDPAPRRD